MGFDNPVVPWREVERRLSWSSGGPTPTPTPTPTPIPTWHGYSTPRELELTPAPVGPAFRNERTFSGRRRPTGFDATPEGCAE